MRVAQALGADLPGKDRIADREFGEVEPRSAARAREGQLRVEHGRRPRARAVRARARRAQRCRRHARRRGSRWRDRLPDADRRYGNARLAFHAARQLNPAGQRLVPRGGRRAAVAGGAGVARARGAARARVGRRAGGRRRDARRAAAGVGVALLARARAGRAGPASDEADARCSRRWRTRDQFLRRARRRGARQALRGAGEQRRSPPPPDALSAFAARPEVKRAVKLAELDMRPESQREWTYIVRGLSDDALLHRRRLRAPRRALRPRDQHRRPHAVAPRLRAALPRAVPRRSSRRPRAGARHRRRAAVRHRAPGVALRARHRVVGRRGRPHAADAGHRALGREAARAQRLPPVADRATPTSTRSSARTTSSTGSSASTGCRRSRPLRIMRDPDARRRGARRRRSKARSGSRRFRSTKPATT